MEKESMMERQMIRVGQAFLGYVCNMVCFLGYYPFVPAVVAASCLWKRKSLFLYVGIFGGILQYMNLGAAMKYLFLTVVIILAIYFYRWSNKKCSGLAAGLIAGMSTVAMNYSDRIMSWENPTELFLGASEGFLVVGGTCMFHFFSQIWIEFRQVSKAAEETPLPGEIPVYAKSQEKMEALMSVVGGLSDVFRSTQTPMEFSESETRNMLEREVEGKLCASCDGCAVCWSQDRKTITQCIQDMLADVLAHRSQEEIVKESYLANCSQYSKMVEEAIQAFGRMELNQAWYQRLIENRQVIAQQLDAMVELMEGWEKEDTLIDAKGRLLLARLRFECKEKGILIREPHLYEDANGRRFLCANLASKWGGGIPLKSYKKAVEKAMHESMRVGKNAKAVISETWMQVCCYEETRFYTLPGIAMHKKSSSPMSGDNFTMFDLERGAHIIGLSDGMGSGLRANQESEMVVDLIERLLKAGFDQHMAIRMMNSAMVLQGENNRFSTLDLASLDLYSGKIQFVKIGAATSFIKRKDHVEVVSDETLPAGAEFLQTLNTIETTVEHGDFLVMVTDGVLEYLHVREPQEVFVRMIERIHTDNAGVLARSLLEQVMQYTGGYAQDDMTILVTGIWERT